MLRKLKQQWSYFLLALGFLTRLPVAQRHDFQPEDFAYAIKFFPLVGMLVGVLTALSFFLAHLIFPLNLSVLLSMVASIVLTGALHEDGFADSADGMGVGGSKEQVLTIMQDSRLGTYGVLALFFMLAGKLFALSSIPVQWLPWILMTGHALSRWSVVYLMATAQYAKSTGKSKTLVAQPKWQDVLWATIFALVPIFVPLLFLSDDSDFVAWIQWSGFILLPMLVGAYWWRTKLLKTLGGYTGDGLGAMQQITELMVYLGALAWIYNV